MQTIIKSTTRRMIDDAGGVEAASAITGISTSTLSKCQRDDHPERTLMAHEIAALERALGTLYLTQTLRKLQRAEMRHLLHNHVEISEGDILRHFGSIQREMSEGQSYAAAAMEDGKFSNGELDRFLLEVEDIERRATEMRLWLCAIKANRQKRAA